MTIPELKPQDKSWKEIERSKEKRVAIIKVENLKTYYPIYGGFFKKKIGEVKAVDDVTFNLYKNETLGLVGESGCGKTTIGNTILNLVSNVDGKIYYGDRRMDTLRVQGLMENIIKRFKNIFLYGISGIYMKNATKFNKFFTRVPKFIQKRYLILKQKSKQLQKDLLIDKFMRKKIQMVFQDPDASLNPRWKVVNLIGEPLRLLEGFSRKRNIRRQVLNLMRIVSMKAEHLDRYPHEFSGGQKQRIVIARALASNPEVIVLDEPTSALDVSVQAQILNLLKELQGKFDLSFLFITHDLSVVQHIADRVAVMYLGKFVETGTVEEIFMNPSHPYTRALLSARPTFDPNSKTNRVILEGDVPSPINPPEGCSFHPRCPERGEHIGCSIENPREIHLGGDHYMVCLPFKSESKLNKLS